MSGGKEEGKVKGMSNRKTARKTLGPRSRRKDPLENLTLEEYYQGWIARRRATAEKQATPYCYNKTYRNHLRQPLGEKKLKDISVRDVLALQRGMAEAEYNPSTVNYTIQVLKIILNDAVAEELLERNPASRVKGLRPSGRSAVASKHRALTEEEQRLFMKEAKKHSFYYEFFAFLLQTGMRHGEAATITWGDVDHEKNVLHVTKSLTFDTGGHVVVGTPKSAAGIRDIPMNEGIRRTLELQMKKTQYAIRPKAVQGSRRIFFSEFNADGLLHNATANSALRQVLLSLDEDGNHIEHFSLHALRDTFATRFIEQGGNPQTLKTLLGHTSLAMTMDLYSQVLPNTRQMEMSSFEVRV